VGTVGIHFSTATASNWPPVTEAAHLAAARLSLVRLDGEVESTTVQPAPGQTVHSFTLPATVRGECAWLSTPAAANRMLHPPIARRPSSKSSPFAWVGESQEGWRRVPFSEESDVSYPKTTGYNRNTADTGA
jgi:hypothetical protein